MASHTLSRRKLRRKVKRKKNQARAWSIAVKSMLNPNFGTIDSNKRKGSLTGMRIGKRSNPFTMTKWRGSTRFS